MGVSLGVVAALVELVTNGILGSGQTVERLLGYTFRSIQGCSMREESHIPGADIGVAVLGNLLVGLLGGARDGTLDSLRDVVGGLLGGLHCEFEGF